MTKKGKYGAVHVRNRNGKLYLDFRCGSDRYQTSLKMVSNPQNDAIAKTIASKIELDISLGQFDTTLVAYLGKQEEKRIPRETKRSELSGMFRYYWDLKAPSSVYAEDVRRFIYKTNPTWSSIHACVNAQNWAPSTHNRYCRELNKFLKWANTDEGIKVELVKNKKDAKPNQENRKPFSDAEIKQILEAFTNNDFLPKCSRYKHSHYLPFVKFLFLTGCRIGEVVGLKKKHFDLDKGTVTIAESLVKENNRSNKRVQKGTKTGSVRIIPLPKTFLEDFLENLDGKKPEDYIFTGPEGKPIDGGNFSQRIWKPILNGLGIEYRVPYAARHTMASRAIEQGIPITGIAYLMGHSDTTMVMKQYGHMINRPELPELDLS